jgi:hypothetical protein
MKNDLFLEVSALVLLALVSGLLVGLPFWLLVTAP